MSANFGGLNLGTNTFAGMVPTSPQNSAAAAAAAGNGGGLMGGALGAPAAAGAAKPSTNQDIMALWQ